MGFDIIGKVAPSLFFDMMTSRVWGKGIRGAFNKALVMYDVWHLWKSRNKQVFGRRKLCSQVVCRNAREEMRIFWQARGLQEREAAEGFGKAEVLFLWQESLRGEIKLNFDGPVYLFTPQMALKIVEWTKKCTQQNQKIWNRGFAVVVVVVVVTKILISLWNAEVIRELS